MRTNCFQQKKKVASKAEGDQDNHCQKKEKKKKADILRSMFLIVLSLTKQKSPEQSIKHPEKNISCLFIHS